MQQYANVRTTLDLPDDLLRRAKIKAVERGTTLRELVSQALARELGSLASSGKKSERPRFPIFSSAAPGTLELTEEDLTQDQINEDLRRHGISD